MNVISFIGGAGTGKSTLASETFANLKKLQYDVELVTEYAKDMTWQESLKVLDNQIYIFAKQHHWQWRLQQKVETIVTDSSLLLSAIYLKGENEPLINLIIHEWKKYNNLLFYIQRGTKYNIEGRNQTLKEALTIDNKILQLLHRFEIDYEIISDLEKSSQQIMNTVIKFLR